MRASYPPLPETPACWSWEPAPLPQFSVPATLLKWQAGRCAVCEVFRPGNNHLDRLLEDHDHRTGDTRGYLCARCNSVEPQTPTPAFRLYRERPPVDILGIRLRYRGHWWHPDTEAANRAWANALATLEFRDQIREEHAARLRAWTRARARGVETAEPELMDVPITPLMQAAMNVGLTRDEWERTLHQRRRGSRSAVDVADDWIARSPSLTLASVLG